MKTLGIILLLGLSLNTSAQFINGTVVDKNKDPIPFVSIGIINRNYGTIAGDNGNFSLDLKRMNPDDTLRFSSIGYKSKDFLVNRIKDNEHFSVLLDDNIYPIGDVQIKPNAKKTIEFGQSKIHKDGGFGFGGFGEGCEVANLEPVQAWGQISQSLNNKLQIVLSGKFKNNHNIMFSRIFSLGYWRKSKMFMDYYLTGYQ